MVIPDGNRKHQRDTGQLSKIDKKEEESCIRLVPSGPARESAEMVCLLKSSGTNYLCVYHQNQVPRHVPLLVRNDLIPRV